MKKYSHDIGNLKQNRIMNFQIGLIVALLVAIGSINYTSFFYEKEERPKDIYIDKDIEIITPPPTKDRPIPPPTKIEIEDIIEIDEPEIVPEPDEPKPTPIDTPTDSKIDDIADKAIAAPPTKKEEKPVIEKPVIVTPPAPPTPPDPVKIAEHMPLFKKNKDASNEKELREQSDAAIISFINSRVKYPPVARENGKEGMAVVRFIVEKDGTMSGFSILKDPGYGMGEAALNVVKKMPNWERAGIMNGRKVRVYFTLPIRFKLSD